MSNAYGVPTMGDPVGVGADLTGIAFNEEWEYLSIVHMSFAENTHLDIAYAVVERFSHNPKNSMLWKSSVFCII